MLWKNWKQILVLLSILFLFAACDKENYHIGFPSKSSPGLSSYLADYFLRDSPLIEDGKTSIYTDEWRYYNGESVAYFYHTRSHVDDYAEPIFEAEEPYVEMYDLYRVLGSRLYNEINMEADVRLPEITLDEENTLHIRTKQGEGSFPISEILEREIDGEMELTVDKVNEEGVILGLRDREASSDYYFFALHDLSEAAIFSYSELPAAIEQEELKPFYPVIQKDNGILGVINQRIINTETHEVKEIDKDDYLSEDTNYVYLNGGIDLLEEGTQRIQKIEDYFDGNEEYHAKYDLDYDKIDKKLKIKSVGVRHGEIEYFHEDFIVLYIDFAGFITGTAGSANVIIDFQEGKEEPSIYLMDTSD